MTQAALDTSRSQIAEPTVVACIADIIKKIQFAASPGGYETRRSIRSTSTRATDGATHNP